MIHIGKDDFSFSILNMSGHKDLLNLTVNINGVSFGTLDSPTYMPSFIAAFKYLLTSPSYFNNNLTSENFLENLYPNNQFINYYHLTLEETFDDFTKLAVRNKKSVFFIFLLNTNPFFTYQNLKENTVYAEYVPITSVESALQELIKYIDCLA
ncbi:hypothetical protein [Acinetobacter gyllenbergii]|uniref:hypothetical protein n=1 Tax=Acinetobacter gyllenbergii TaxID=134534 RepID=UPI0009D726AC|nr:hypothetical protein [Acinetobacter gyllenbergii]